MLNGLTKSAKLKSQLVKTFGVEEVFVVPTFDTDTIPNGFTPKKAIEKKKINLELRNAKFVLRSDAEYDMVFKQIIPMTVIKDSYQNYYVMRRKEQPKDSRMQGTKTLLLGGHISPVDGYSDNFERCLTRHLKHDSSFKTVPYFGRSFYGYIKDEKSTLADHLGYIYFTTITNCYKSFMDIKPAIGTGAWMSKDQLLSNYDNFDPWCRLIISHLVFGERKDNYLWKQQETPPVQQPEQNQ